MPRQVAWMHSQLRRKPMQHTTSPQIMPTKAAQPSTIPIMAPTDRPLLVPHEPPRSAFLYQMRKLLIFDDNFTLSINFAQLITAQNILLHNLYYKYKVLGH